MRAFEKQSNKYFSAFSTLFTVWPESIGARVHWVHSVQQSCYLVREPLFLPGLDRPLSGTHDCCFPKKFQQIPIKLQMQCNQCNQVVYNVYDPSHILTTVCMLCIHIITIIICSQAHHRAAFRLSHCWIFFDKAKQLYRNVCRLHSELCIVWRLNILWFVYRAPCSLGPAGRLFGKNPENVMNKQKKRANRIKWAAYFMRNLTEETIRMPT